MKINTSNWSLVLFKSIDNCSYTIIPPVRKSKSEIGHNQTNTCILGLHSWSAFWSFQWIDMLVQLVHQCQDTEGTQSLTMFCNLQLNATIVQWTTNPGSNRVKCQALDASRLGLELCQHVQQGVGRCCNMYQLWMFIAAVSELSAALKDLCKKILGSSVPGSLDGWPYLVCCYVPWYLVPGVSGT